MFGVIVFLAGIAVGAIGMVGVLVLAQPPGRRLLPPSTRRAIRRDRRQLADIRPVINRDRRQWITPADGDFDNEETH
jgi:hypothetical protein